MPELLVELLVLLAVALQQLFQLLLYLFFDAPFDGLQLAVLLQHFARYVQVQVWAVHDAAHEGKRLGQKLLACLGDQHRRTVELQSVLEVLGVEGLGNLRRHEQQRVVVQRAFRVQWDGQQRVGEVVELGLVELGILLARDLGFLARPYGGHGVQCLGLDIALVLGRVVVAGVVGFGLLARLFHVHAYGVAHVVAVALHQVLERVLAEVVVVVLGRLALAGVFAHVQDDVGAAFVALGLRDGVAFQPVAFPAPGRIRAVGARRDDDLVGHHERRVEADAELPDDVHFLVGLRLVTLLELEAAGVCDGAEVLFQLGVRHADAVVGYRNGARVAVHGQLDAEVAAYDGFVAVLQRLQVELVEGVRRVGYQLAQEDVLVRVDGVHHQIEELLAFRLELAHGACPSFPSWFLGERGRGCVPRRAALSLRLPAILEPRCARGLACHAYVTCLRLPQKI